MDFIKYRVPPFPPSNKRGKGEIIEAHHKECSFSLPVETTSTPCSYRIEIFKGHIYVRTCVLCVLFLCGRIVSYSCQFETSIIRQQF